LGVDFFDLNLSVGEVVIENEILVSSIEAVVLPQDIETKNFPVIIQKAFEGFVWSTTFQLNFNVVLKFSLIWRSLLEVYHGSSLGEEILWITLILAQ
jgi:hypothetical protein